MDRLAGLRFAHGARDHLSLLIAAGLLAVLLGSAPRMARAEENGPGLPAGMIFPIRGDSVRLDIARVTIEVPRDDDPGKVVSSYRLRNLGTQTVDLEIGFARGIPGNPPARGVGTADSMELRMNRSLIPLHIESTAKIPQGKLPPAIQDSVPAWEVKIQPFETVDVDLTYRVAWAFDSDEEKASRELAFHASPAMLWSGPIDDFTVSFAFDEMTATLLNCAMEREKEGKREARERKEAGKAARKGRSKQGAKQATKPGAKPEAKPEAKAEGNEEGKEEREGPCIESSITPPGYEWYARGPGWRFRDGKFPTDFRIRVSWHEEEEND